MKSRNDNERVVPMVAGDVDEPLDVVILDREFWLRQVEDNCWWMLEFREGVRMAKGFPYPSYPPD